MDGSDGQYFLFLPWVTYLVNPWQCNLHSSMQLHHVGDRISNDNENALFGVNFYCVLQRTMLEPNYRPVSGDTGATAHTIQGYI